MIKEKGEQMLSKSEIQKLAKQVVKSMRIGRKYNSDGIAMAKRKFPWIEKFIRQYAGKTIIPGKIKDFKLTDSVVNELTHPKYGPLLGK